ncbi:MAG: serine hydrolase [Pseudomonadota bacterium]|nr:serine hydrolase [Pseudomonadota bacterium]
MRNIEIDRRGLFALGAGGAAVVGFPRLAFAQETASPVDAIVAAFMRAFEVPGMGIAIVRPGQPAFTRGYGIREIGKPGMVDADTLFAIASNTKSFVGASLAMLVEEGKLGWDEPVVTYMPDFKMSDGDATRMMTVRDLLVHRSGLALGAGDLMRFPRSNHSRMDLFRGLQHLKLTRGFRSGYAYDNILYVVAGVLIERVSGLKWEDFVTARVLRPLGMRTAVADRELLRITNVAARHARLGPPFRGVGKLERVEPNESIAGSPAGGIHASAREIAKWFDVQIGRGQSPGGPRLWSEAQSDQLWAPQVITTATKGPNAESPTRSVLQGYALGWFVSQFRDRRLLSHSGGRSGQITQTALLPEQGIGVAVFTNTEDRIPSQILRNALLDHTLGITSTDWLAVAKAADKARIDEAMREVAGGYVKRPDGAASLPLDAYAGAYRDPWYGDIVVTRRNGGLRIDFTRTPLFKSKLEPWGKDAFRTHFAGGAGEDAVVQFVVESGKVPRMTMKALSPLADFSYDFHGLRPSRVQ